MSSSTGDEPASAGADVSFGSEPAAGPEGADGEGRFAICWRSWSSRACSWSTISCAGDAGPVISALPSRTTCLRTDIFSLRSASSAGVLRGASGEGSGGDSPVEPPQSSHSASSARAKRKRVFPRRNSSPSVMVKLRVLAPRKVASFRASSTSRTTSDWPSTRRSACSREMRISQSTGQPSTGERPRRTAPCAGSGRRQRWPDPGPFTTSTNKAAVLGQIESSSQGDAGASPTQSGQTRRCVPSRQTPAWRLAVDQQVAA